jgi:hypothetical protein
MRKAKRAYQKRKQVAREAKGQANKNGRGYQNATTTGLEATSRSIVEINKGFREIADEMNDYSKRSLEDAFRTWQKFLDTRPLGHLIEIQTWYAQNAYASYVAELSKLGELYLGLTRRVSNPLERASRRPS